MKRDDNTLIEGEVLLESVLDAIPDILGVLGVDRRIIKYNRAGYDYLGRDPADVVGRTCYTLINGNEPCEPCATAKAIATRRPARILKYIDKDDTWFDARSYPVLDDKGEVVLVIEHLRNVSEEKKVESELRSSRRLLSGILNTIPQAVFWKDKDGRYLGCNPVFAEACGLATTDEVIGKTDYDLPGSRGQADAYRADDREVMFSTTPKRHIIEPMLHADGGLRWIDVSKMPLLDEQGRVVGVLGVFDDITAQKRTTEELEESRKMIMLVLDTIPVRVFWKNRDLVFLGCNLHFARDAGVDSPTEVIGRTDYDFSWGEENTEAYRRDDKLVMESGLSKWDYEESQMTPDGHQIWLRTSKTPLRDRDGNVIGVLGTYEDISERKRQEKERRQLELQFQQSQKLESLGLLAGGIAHDFNNMLVAIMGYADLALKDLDEARDTRDNIEEIRQAALRASELTNQMLAYSGKGHFVVGRMDLNSLVREMTRLLASSISKKVKFEFHLTEPLPAVFGDRAQLRQVVMNLVTNASDAVGAEHGLIAIHSDITELPQEVMPGNYLNDSLKGGCYVTLEIRDDGSGMDEETLEKLFDPFFSTKSCSRGLGLAAVLGIVRGHGGAITVRSRPGEGACFKIFLPAAEAAVVERTEANEVDTPQSRDELWHGHGCILVVDDEESVRRVANLMLRRIGFEVLLASDGIEALQVFIKNSDRIIAVLLDHSMPRLDGPETLARLRSSGCEIPVVMMSGYASGVALEKIDRLDIQEFIQKPFRLATLITTLRTALGACRA